MSEHVTIVISKPLFERLQKQAAPLVDTTDIVINRLLDFWENHPEELIVSKNSEALVTIKYWKSSRGDVLPVGAELKGKYLGKYYTAVVEQGGIRFNEKLYDNLSPAAIAAKHLAGTIGKAANTNGRDFWKIRDPDTRQWLPVSTLRAIHRLNANELLAELDSMP
jgi:hypothetical protein